MKTNRRPAWIVAILMIALGAFAGWRWMADPRPHVLNWADGTEAFFLSGTEIRAAAGYPTPREIHVDGDVFFRVPPAAEPLIIRTRLLVLTITGETALRITAWAKQTGEQAEVLRGNVIAHKSYESRFKEPDTLTGGQMVMINRTIDLMEKEKFDPAELRVWSDALMASAKRAR